jgi:hypothetical protein
MSTAVLEALIAFSPIIGEGLTPTRVFKFIDDQNPDCKLPELMTVEPDDSMSVLNMSLLYETCVTDVL